MKTKFVILISTSVGSYYYSASGVHDTAQKAQSIHDATQFEYYEAAQSFISTTLSIWDTRAIFRIDKIFMA